jgi:hypothetical protein
MAEIISEHAEGHDYADKRHVQAKETKQIARSEELGENFFTLKGKDPLGSLLLFYFAGCLFGFVVTFWFTHR